ncbi:MAG: nicotinate-nucleotide adenylyltransferase [Puniceicoccaceae bacterium]|nr:nicotinate-nucleotide adenylyltransferase [Puniceicoccaceae bacterium]
MFRIVLIGAESTGKSTLCQQLADYFQAPFSPEYVRDFVDSQQRAVRRSDLETIVDGQIMYEKTACQQATSLVFHDTNLLSNALYAEYYFKECPEKLKRSLEENQYDLYLFCQDDIPWEADRHQRESLAVRRSLQERFEQALRSSQIPTIRIKGSPAHRLKTAIDSIETLILGARN